MGSALLSVESATAFTKETATQVDIIMGKIAEINEISDANAVSAHEIESTTIQLSKMTEKLNK